MHTPGRSSCRFAAYRDPATSILLAALAVTALGLTPASIPAVYLAAVTPELVRVDLAEHRLPNRMVVPGLVVGVVAALVGWSPAPAVAGLALGGFLWLLGLGGGVGMGDVKLGALIGLASPTLAVAVAAPLLAFVAGGVAAAAVLARDGRGSRVAFGPFLLLGYWVAVVLAGVTVSAAGAP